MPFRRIDEEARAFRPTLKARKFMGFSLGGMSGTFYAIGSMPSQPIAHSACLFLPSAALSSVNNIGATLFTVVQ